MITRERFLELRDAASTPDAAQTLEREGFAVLRGAFAANEVALLASEIEHTYETVAADVRNPPRPSHGHAGGNWHIDAGPHVPRPPGVPWDDRIPYPVFAVAVHLLLRDCDLESGPTAVIPGSHRSGLAPPFERMQDASLTWEGVRALSLPGRAGEPRERSVIGLHPPGFYDG